MSIFCLGELIVQPMSFEIMMLVKMLGSYIDDYIGNDMGG